MSARAIEEANALTGTYTNEYTRAHMGNGVEEQELRANPYVGLRPFFDEDHLYFFGRERQIAELLDILRQQRFLGVVGSSGSGKSSLVRAGLLPALLSGFLVKDRDRWRRIQMKPGDAPFANLAAGLLKAMGDDNASDEARQSLEQEIRDGHTDAVIDYLTSKLEPNANLFLLVDQFEEIFAFRGIDVEEDAASLDPARRKERARRKAEAADFVDLMLALANRPELPIYVTLTMRTDFLGDGDVFFGLPEALNRGRYLVPRMTRDELRDAVECPALLLGASVAPRLVDLVLNAFGDRFDQLPMLQHALLRTWDKWQQSGGLGSMDVPHYERAGGLEGALNLDAEEEEGALKGLDIDVASRVFKRLTDTDLSQRRIRSPARISELVAAAGVGSAMVEGVLKPFTENGRNFVHLDTDGKPDDPRVDISHESLIRQWKRLRNWVDEERLSRDQYKELVARARKQPRTLIRDPELQTFVEWKEKVAPTSGWAARYSASDDEFNSAMRYLDDSVASRVSWRAETELGRLWWFGWQLIAVLAVLFFVARDLAERTTGVDVSALGLIGQTAIDSLPKVIAFIGIVATPLLLYALWEGLKRVHRWFFLPSLVQEVQSTGGYGASRHPLWVLLTGLRTSGGRLQRQAAMEAAGFEEAVVAHNTTYATAARRIAAYLVDLVFVLPMVAIALLLIIPRPISESWSNYSTLRTLIVFLVVGWLYTTPQIASRRMATVGMNALGIFRTDLRGEPLSFARATAWYVARIFSVLAYGLGFLTQLVSSRRQTLHDLLASTVVLRRPPQDAGVVPSNGEQQDWWSSRRAAWEVGVVAYAAVIALAGFLWRSPSTGAALATHVVGVALGRPQGSILKGGEITVGYRLFLVNGDTVSGKNAADMLTKAGVQLTTRAFPDTIVYLHDLSPEGTVDMRGLNKGHVTIWAQLAKNGHVILYGDSVSVSVIEPTNDRISAALKAYAVFDAKRLSDSVTDEALNLAIKQLDSTYGTALREPESGLRSDLDRLLFAINILVQLHQDVDSVLNPKFDVDIVDKKYVVNNLLVVRKAAREGHGPRQPDYDAVLRQLDDSLKALDGTVDSASVCQAPCNVENQLDREFAPGVNVVIRLRYKFTQSGSLSIEWWRDGKRVTSRPYGVAPAPQGFRLWDQKNVDQEGEWKVRVLNGQHQPVFQHVFTVQAQAQQPDSKESKKTDLKPK